MNFLSYKGKDFNIESRPGEVMIIIRNSQLPWLVLIDKRIKFGLDLKPLFRDCPSEFGKRSFRFRQVN